jgi:hypothetical protein
VGGPARQQQQQQQQQAQRAQEVEAHLQRLMLRLAAALVVARWTQQMQQHCSWCLGQQPLLQPLLQWRLQRQPQLLPLGRPCCSVAPLASMAPQLCSCKQGIALWILQHLLLTGGVTPLVTQVASIWWVPTGVGFHACIETHAAALSNV